MRHREGIKGMSFILALILCLNFTAFDGVWAKELQGYEFQEISAMESDRKSAKSDGETKEEDQTVRVIVELEGEPVIQEAIDRGISYSQLDQSIVMKKEEEIQEEKEDFISELRDRELDADLVRGISYDTVLNGVALTVEESEIKKLEEIPGVKRVFISQEFERPALSSSENIIGSNYARNDLKYKGEGTVVAIIDSGLDYTHKALKVDDKSTVKYGRKEMEELISEKHLRGRYFSLKVPYGYNYYDHNQNTFDRYGVMHGMHVAGIVAANGGVDESIYGVAPNAQLLAMKVFSDDVEYPTTFTDIWLKALDDAIALKADVVNMSLGSPAGITREGQLHPEIEILEKARKAGVVVAVAAGNEGSIVDGNYYSVKPLKENYDTALIASPSLNEDTISVASMENTQKRVSVVKWKDHNGIGRRAEVNLYRPSGSDEVVTAIVEDIGKGSDEELNKAMVKDRIVMTEIPESIDKKEFYDMIKKVMSRKPKALILYNTHRMGDFLGGRLAVHNELSSFIVGRITHRDYNRIIKIQKSTPDFQLTISATPESIVNHLGGRMSKFSSWGPTPDLRIKPELTAPGGHIYSTIENNSYRNMSGTSMASPQVAGASAILKQYLKTKGISGEESAHKVKLLLMNTATPIENEEGTPYFVRQQGSGAIDLEKALKTSVIVRARGTNDGVDDGKLELKQLKDKRFQVQLSIENFGEEAKEYEISVRGMYEKIEGNRRMQQSALLSSSQNDIKYSVKIEGHSSESVRLDVDYSDASELEEGNFIEGYIQLRDISEYEGCNLSVPFLGFFGEWSRQKAIDSFEMPELDSKEREVQFMVNRESNSPSSMFVTTKMLRLPVIDNIVYFSPSSIYYQNAGVRLSPLRNMDKVEYSILDADTGELLRVIGVSREVRKVSRLSVRPGFRYMPDSLWDGRIGGHMVEEGKKYIYQIKAKLNNNGIGSDEEQVYRYPVQIDNSSPEFTEGVTLEPMEDNLKLVKFKVQDEGSGIERIYLESIKYVSDSSSSDPHSPPLPPGVDPTPPGEKKSEDEEKKEEGRRVDEQKIGLKPGQKIKYGKYIKLNFVNKEEIEGKILPKVEEGRLLLSEKDIPASPGESGEVFINRNHTTSSVIEVEVPFLSDSTHMMVSAGDHLGNYSRKVVATGINENYHTLFFMNFFNSLRDRNTRVFVNDKLLETPNIHLKDTNAQIKIQLPDDKVHMNLLYLRKGRELIYLIENGIVNKDQARRYRLSYSENAVEFLIDPLNSSYEIITGFKEGRMEQQEEKEVLLDLSRLDRDDFESLTVKNAGKKIEVSEGTKTLTLLDGKTLISGRFKPSYGKKVIGVILHKENGMRIPLRPRSTFDVIEEKKEGYYASKYGVDVFFHIKDNTAIEILYDGNKPSYADIAEGSEHSEDMDTAVDPSNRDQAEDKEIQQREEPSLDKDAREGMKEDVVPEYEKREDPVKEEGSEGISSEEKAEEKKEEEAPSKSEDREEADLEKEKKKENSQDETEDSTQDKTEKDPVKEGDKDPSSGEENLKEEFEYPDAYPTVWIQTPKLLSILTPDHISDEKIQVKGFVGHIRSDDGVESLELTLIDKEGNVSGDSIRIGREDWKKEYILYSEGERTLYEGRGCYFSVEVPVKDFEVNLRAELTTLKGKKVSIVRRMFYDSISPELEYAVFERGLNDERVKIRFIAKDNSLKLNLYRNDSLIAQRDMSLFSLQGNGVELQEEIEVPLKVGQNELKFKAVDMGRHETEKTVYIYRTKE